MHTQVIKLRLVTDYNLEIYENGDRIWQKTESRKNQRNIQSFGWALKYLFY